MGIDFLWTPNNVIPKAPKYNNLRTPSTGMKEQRLNLAGEGLREYKLTFSQADPDLRNKILFHYNFHRADYQSFMWKSIPSYVSLINLVPRESQTFMEDQDAAQYWTDYDGSSITLTQDQAGPDGELGATRIQCTQGGATNQMKFTFLDTRAAAAAGETYRLNMWARKYTAGSNNFIISIDPGDPDPETTISVATWQEIDLSGAQSGANRRIRCKGITAASALDMVLMYPVFTRDAIEVIWTGYAEQPVGPFDYQVECTFEGVI